MGKVDARKFSLQYSYLCYCHALHKHGHQSNSPPQHLDQLLQENCLTESHGDSYLGFLGR